MQSKDVFEDEISDLLILHNRNDLSNKIDQIMSDITPKSTEADV